MSRLGLGAYTHGVTNAHESICTCSFRVLLLLERSNKHTSGAYSCIKLAKRNVSIQFVQTNARNTHSLAAPLSLSFNLEQRQLHRQIQGKGLNTTETL